MKILFMGTPEFAAVNLKAIVDKHDVVAVVSQPDRPKGRGKKLQPTPVKEVALEYNIPVYQPEKIKDKEFVDFLKTIDADVYVVVAYGQILSQEILDIPKYGCVNVHGSLLPKYRGSSPIQWSILNGDKITGVTTILMDKNCDTGDMLVKKTMEILPDDTYGSLHDRMAPIGAEVLLETLEKIENGTVVREKQNEAEAVHVPMIFKSMGKIDWTKNSNEIVNLIHGLNPAPGAFTNYNNEVMKIWNAKETTGNGQAGEILVADSKKGLVVATGNGAIEITEIQAKGGKKMNPKDYLRGHAMEEKTVLK